MKQPYIRDEAFELDQGIAEMYPKLYRNRLLENKKHDIGWGLKIHHGWVPLVMHLSACLEACIEQMPKELQRDFAAVSIKAKTGSLRVHLERSTPEMERLIEKAVSQSKTTCEMCGKTKQTYLVDHRRLTRVCQDDIPS